jgi:hypothetical protein
MVTDTERLDFFEEFNQWFRYNGDPSMDGARPCWYVYAPSVGRTRKKTLREAIDVAMIDHPEWEARK